MMIQGTDPLEIADDAQSGGVLDFALLNRPSPPALGQLRTVRDITAQVAF